MAVQSVSSTISSIVREALDSGCLSEKQEQHINDLLWAKQFSAEDFEALDTLVDALFHRRIEVVIAPLSQAA